MLPKSTSVLGLLSCLLLAEAEVLSGSKSNARKFPDNFLFGAATAAYQVEGGWDADGKSPNIWDHLTHTNPCVIADCSNGDIAADSYNQYQRDVQMMRELGLDYYRFSLSWSRILPTGFPDKINEAGVQYYNNLINEILKYNIKPIVTIYHWDLPQKLQDLGGWPNPHIVDWYTDYARVAFQLFGDRVKSWITINEPTQVCISGYGSADYAPLFNMSGVADYLCAKNLLVAHAKAYHIYDDEFRPTQQGTIGITISANWLEPDTEKDAAAAEECMQFEFGLFAHPIFSESGDYPPVMKERIAANSAEQGFKRSRLPEFTREEIDLLKGSSDFFGLNSYTGYVVYRNESVEGYYAVPSFSDDMAVFKYQPDDWVGAASSWLKNVPWAFHKLLTKIREDYGNPPIYITENGMSTHGGLYDNDRINYVRGYLSALLDAIDEGTDIRMYLLWSLMDNYEWLAGYTECFGIYEVDYESPDRPRTPRKSAFVYKEILRSRTLDFDYEPDTIVMAIDEGH